MFQKNLVDKIKTHNNVFFSAIVPFVRLCGRDGQATDDIMAHAHCMLCT